MTQEESMIRMNPQFIRLSDGSLMNINNIVAISEADGKVFVLGYQRIPITEDDMAALLGNIEIIDDDEHQHHCGQDCDCDDACCQAGSPCGRSAVTYDPNESQPVDVKPAITGDSLRNLMGMQVVRIDVPCDVCAMDTDDCVKVELAGGDYICLAKRQEDERPVINFDEEDEQEDTTPNIMAAIREKVDDFMDYLESVVKD